MALTPLHRTCSDSRGGVRSISLARASEIENIVFDPAAHCWSTTGPLEAFVSVEFPENGAHYEEKAVREQGAMKITHTLVFKAGLPDRGEDSITAQLEEASATGGIAALVELLSGERLLAGFSRRFGVQMPLRLAAADASTGTKPADRAERTFTLQSVDTAPALPLRMGE